MPETPRWLVQKGRLDEARRVLARLGSRDGTLEEIQAAVAREADQQGAGWAAVFKPKTRGVRRAIVVGVGVGAAQQMLAEEALLFYLPRILLDLGETRNRVYAALVGMGVLKTLCIVVAAIYLDRSGRRPMLLPVWKSNFGRPARCCLRSCVCSMAWRFTKVHAIFLRIT